MYVSSLGSLRLLGLENVMQQYATSYRHIQRIDLTVTFPSGHACNFDKVSTSSQDVRSHTVSFIS
jgi:hypothetical protein